MRFQFEEGFNNKRRALLIRFVVMLSFSSMFFCIVYQFLHKVSLKFPQNFHVKKLGKILVFYAMWKSLGWAELGYTLYILNELFLEADVRKCSSNREDSSK